MIDLPAVGTYSLNDADHLLARTRLIYSSRPTKKFAKLFNVPSGSGKSDSRSGSDVTLSWVH